MKKIEDLDKLFPSEYQSNLNGSFKKTQANPHDNPRLSKENDKFYPENRRPNYQKASEKPVDEQSEYKRLQDKLNVLEKKILSIKNNYDLTLKRSEKSPEAPKKAPPKKPDFVSTSCTFYDSARDKDKEKPRKDPSPAIPSPVHKPKKVSLEIALNPPVSNPIKQIETSKKCNKLGKDEADRSGSPLGSYVTQVRPHSIFPANVYEGILQKNLNISEISLKNDSGRDSMTPKNSANGKAQASCLKVSLLKSLLKTGLYYISPVFKAFFQQKSQEQEVWKEHFQQTMQAVLFTKFLKDPDQDALDAKVITLPRKEYYRSNSLPLLLKIHQ